jgi:hypothetical protein
MLRAGTRRDGMRRLARAAVLAVCLTWSASCAPQGGSGASGGPGSAPAGSPAAQPAALDAAALNPSTNTVYMCPMDKDIRAHGPGKCPRCGMALVTSIPDPVEYHLDLGVSPAPVAGSPVRLTFEVTDPWKGNPVTKYSVIHEKLFHAFIVSEDLEFFRHGHPDWRENEHAFTYDVTLPKAGMYRVLGDFYPDAATPQLLSQTLYVPGQAPAHRALARDYSPKQADNLKVAITTSPETLVAGLSARVRFLLEPGDGLERYLGAWAHMLAASDDLIDMMHAHPTIADGTHELQFDLVFPRPRVYRIWVQFQRHGVVNTVHFDVPVIASDPS